jgi:methylmalonyl-CoA mutase
LAIICSSDKLYADVAAEVMAALKAAGAEWLAVAGRPDSALVTAGADGFIYAGDDCLASLCAMHEKLGV